MIQRTAKGRLDLALDLFFKAKTETPTRSELDNKAEVPENQERMARKDKAQEEAVNIDIERWRS
jgi:hypothetical protein